MACAEVERGHVGVASAAFLPAFFAFYLAAGEAVQGIALGRLATAVVVTHVAVNRSADGLESSLSQRRARVFKWNRRAEVRAQARSARPRPCGTFLAREIT